MFRSSSQSLMMRCTSLFLLTRSSSAFHNQHSFVRAARSYSSTQTMYASSATLTFGTSLDKLEDADYNATMVIGRKESIEQAMPSMMETLGLDLAQPIQAAMMDAVKEKTGGSSRSIVPKGDTAHTFAICGLPTKVSRNNHPMAVHTLTKYIGTVPSKGNTRVIIVTDSNIAPLASAAAKAFPLFNMKSKAANPDERKVHVVFMRPDGTVVDTEQQLKAAQAVASGVQLAARLVDSHPELLTTTRFAKEVENIVKDHPEIKMTQLMGEELRAYGGLYGVGKAANCPPRMIILEYDGQGDETVALVGKGIVYDTGGLSLKSKTGMCGMKHDMGGAAGVLGGFYSAVKLGVKKKVYCILCLAENAIGPDAFRNDDILTMYSGKTVEVNNCDAEGRLVLADGVAHATKHFENLDLVVDMATLTGSQLVATGKKHAGILANTEALEKRAMEAGMHSGDLCFPLLYAPELLMDEFKSEVADMRNSVKDRSNAQTSCAGHFIEAHLNEGYQGGWLHVDMAGPGTLGQRGTGYGVGLVLSLLEAPGF